MSLEFEQRVYKSKSTFVAQLKSRADIGQVVSTNSAVLQQPAVLEVMQERMSLCVTLSQRDYFGNPEESNDSNRAVTATAYG